MRTLATLATTTLLLLFVAAAPAYPQDQDTKPGQQQEDKNKDKAAKPDKTARPGAATPSQEQPAARPEDRKNNQRMDQGPTQNDNRQPEAARPQEQRSGQETNRNRQQGGAQAQRGKRIPDDKFRASFGRQHTFHVQRERIVTSPQPVIVYGGYSFNLIDAWPVEWGFDDPVYVDFVDDGYFLFNPLHPEIRIAVFIAE